MFLRRTFCRHWLVILGILAWSIAQAQPAPEAASGYQNKQVVSARHAMVATANPLATEAAYNILRRGGTALDAAIVAQMVLNLVEPQSSGIGGGAFLLYHQAKTGKLWAYDGRETAPAAATPERFLDATGKPLPFYQAVVGGKAVGVPGLLAMLAMAHQQQGRLPWADLFEPAIVLARNGFPVSPRLHTLLAKEKFLPKQSAARSYFYQADGSPLPIGFLRTNPELADTFTILAKQGIAPFYHGEIAVDLVRAVQEAPTNSGDLTLQDLEAYRPKLREPICAPYRRYKVCGMPPPSSGGITVLQMLGMLANFNLPNLPPLSLWSTHLFSEVGRLAYADRNQYLADPDFVRIPTGLLQQNYLQQRAKTILWSNSMGQAKPGLPRENWQLSEAAEMTWELPATSHISIIDAEGNAVAMTTTIEDSFGSRVWVRGFLLNNQLTDFSFTPSEAGQPLANRLQPGKRPRSSMAPTIVYDRSGKIKMVVGSPGGGAIINYVAKTLVGVLDWGLDPQAAINLPNMGSRNGATELEQGSALVALQPKLEALGHRVQVLEQTSGVQAIVRNKKGWQGGADPRREGMVMGY